MTKVIILLFVLVTSTASFAQQPTGQPSGVIFSLVNQHLQVNIGLEKSVATIKLLDRGGNLLYPHKEKTAQGVQLNFDLRKLELSIYKLSVYKDGQTITKMIEVQAIAALKQVILKT